VSDRDYASFTREIILGQESVLKSIFIKLFIDIHSSIKDHIEIPKKDYADYLEDVIYFPGDLELTDATRLFTNNYFIVKKLKRFNSSLRPSSLKNIHTILSTTRFNERNAKKSILNDIELSEGSPYRFTTLQIHEVGRIADEINYVRHMVAHNNMIQKSPQALIFFSNLARLFQITPDLIKNQITGFSELNEYVKENYFNSIIQVYRPDFFELKISDDKEDERDLNSDFYNKIDGINSKIEELNKIKLNVSQNQKNIENLIGMLKSIDQKVDSINAISEFTPNIEEVKHLSRAMPLSEENEIEDRTDIEAIKIENHIGSGLSQIEKAKLSQTDLELHYSSYEEAIADGIDRKKVNLWAQNDLINGYDLSTEDMLYVDNAAESGGIDESIYFDYIKGQNITDEKLTEAELYDELMALRVEIKKDMESKYNYFANWHNILMTSIAHEIIEEKIIIKDKFMELSQYKKYYNSEQMTKAIKQLENVDELRTQAKELMDYQVEKYWPKIEDLVRKAI